MEINILVALHFYFFPRHIEELNKLHFKCSNKLPIMKLFFFLAIGVGLGHVNMDKLM